MTPCTKCGEGERTSNGRCRACNAAAARARYIPKPPRPRPTAEQIRDNARARGRRHYARHAAQIREDYAANRETIRARRRDLRAQLPDEMRAIQSRDVKQRRRARNAGARYVEYVDPLVLLERDDGVCGVCGTDVDPFAFETDHVLPLSRGGEHSYANTQVAHPTCNRRKHVSVTA